MASKHLAKRDRQGVSRKLVFIAAVTGSIVIAMILFMRVRPEGRGGTSDEGTKLELSQDGAAATNDRHVQGAEDAIDTQAWMEQLDSEQKAELDIAYELSVSNGYQGSFDEWVSAEVVAHLNDRGNVVITLPDGGEFVVVRGADPENDQNNGVSERNTANNEAVTNEDDSQSALIAVDTVVVHKGDKRVALPIKVLGNPGILGLTFSVSYDESAMTLVGAENGGAFEGPLALTHSRTYESGCLFTWDGVDIKPEQVRDGIALTLYFDVADDASGLHSVAVRGASAFDADLRSISLTAQDGSIVIE